MKKILTTVALLFLIGCDKAEVYDEPYSYDDRLSISFTGHNALCLDKPDDMFCKTRPSTGDIQPTWKEVYDVVQTLHSNFTYTVDSNDEWEYNHTVYEKLEEDCDGNALTLTYHLLEESGIGREYIDLAMTYSESRDSYHMFVAVNTRDRGWTHFDYGYSGEPLEELNWHMLMTDVGSNKWIKGSRE